MRNILRLGLMTFAALPTKICWACSMCFYGSPKSTANTALRMGVLSLFIILLGVLFAFAKFFLNIRKRARLMTQSH